MKRAFWRYTRQLQVIGEASQQALANGRAEIREDDLEGLFAALYLAGAGVGTLVVPPSRVEDIKRFNPEIRLEEAALGALGNVNSNVNEGDNEALASSDEFTFRDSAARQAARGARRALVTMGALVAEAEPTDAERRARSPSRP